MRIREYMRMPQMDANYANFICGIRNLIRNIRINIYL